MDEGKTYEENLTAFHKTYNISHPGLLLPLALIGYQEPYY